MRRVNWYKFALVISMVAAWLSSFMAWRNEEYARAALFMVASLWSRIELMGMGD